MLSCVSETVVEIRSCGIELSRIIPEGYGNIATCYESSGSTGDALCAFNGTGYTLDVTHVDIPETTICDGLVPPNPRLSFKDGAEDNTTTPHILTRGASLEPETFPALTDRRSSSANIKTEAPICSNPWPECTTCLSRIISTEETTTTPTPSPSPSPTLTNLPTDPSGKPYSVVSEIVSVVTDTKPGQKTPSQSSKGVVLVEPSVPVTTAAGGDNWGGFLFGGLK